MQSDSLRKNIVIETSKGKIKLKPEEYTRWLCLIEALDIISRKAILFKVDLRNKDIDWVKPLAFQKYIVERFDSMINEVVSNEGVNFKIKKTKCITSPEPALQ
jgi:hypothetical protein